MTVLDELRTWLDEHANTPPVGCVLCQEPVAKDTVVEHLMERHSKVDLALLVALWWFLDEKEGA